MRRAAVLIFSIALIGALSAKCEPLSEISGSKLVWNLFTGYFGNVPFPEKMSVCTGRAYFFEIKGGATMRSALDRRRHRILRRDNSQHLLAHELAHVYLDMRWKILPYSVSELFVVAMAEPEKCEMHASNVSSKESIQASWKARASLAPCELLLLLRAILDAEDSVRDALPLR